MFKQRYEKSTLIIAQTHYTVIFSLSWNRNREVSRGGLPGIHSIWVLIWLFIIGPPLRYLFRKKTSEPRRLPALFTVKLFDGAYTRYLCLFDCFLLGPRCGICLEKKPASQEGCRRFSRSHSETGHSLDICACLIVYYWAPAAVSV
jgi:hypothetical protein